MPRRARRSFTPEFKAEVVLTLLRGIERSMTVGFQRLGADLLVVPEATPLDDTFCWAPELSVVLVVTPPLRTTSVPRTNTPLTAEPNTIWLPPLSSVADATPPDDTVRVPPEKITKPALIWPDDTTRVPPLSRMLEALTRFWAAEMVRVLPAPTSSVRSADCTAVSAFAVPDDGGISGCWLGMSWTFGSEPARACLAWRMRRGDASGAVLNGSLTIIVLTPLTTFSSRPARALEPGRQAYEFVEVFPSWHRVQQRAEAGAPSLFAPCCHALL